MANATRNTTNSKWEVSIPHSTINAGSSSTKTLTLSTAGKYVDYDIIVTSTASAQAASDTSAAAMTVTGSATVKPNNITAANGTAKVVSTSTTTTAPDTGYYIGLTPSTASSTTITQTKTALTAGYLGEYNQVSASGSVTGGSGTKRYVQIQSGSFGTSDLNTKTTTNALKDYEENTSVAIPSEGSLLIEEGYYPKTFISLDQLLDGRNEDKQTAATGTSSSLRSGSVMWTEDGQKVSGTMSDLNPSLAGGGISGSVTDITGSSITLNDSSTDPGTGISVTASASAGRAAVTYNGAQTGYVSKSNGATALAATSSNTSLTSRTEFVTALTVGTGKTLGSTTSAGVTVAGTLYEKTNSATAGTIYTNAYVGTEATGNQKITDGGKWVQNNVTPSGSAQGPFYGRTSVSAVTSDIAKGVLGSTDLACTFKATKSTNATNYSVTLPTTAPSEPYFSITDNVTITTGKVYSGTHTDTTVYVSIYDGSYTLT